MVGLTKKLSSGITNKLTDWLAGWGALGGWGGKHKPRGWGGGRGEGVGGREGLGGGWEAGITLVELKKSQIPIHF